MQLVLYIIWHMFVHFPISRYTSYQIMNTYLFVIKRFCQILSENRHFCALVAKVWLILSTDRKYLPLWCFLLFLKYVKYQNANICRYEASYILRHKHFRATTFFDLIVNQQIKILASNFYQGWVSCWRFVEYEKKTIYVIFYATSTYIYIINVNIWK